VSASLPVERVAIVGLGLIGGSIARALKQLQVAPLVAATDSHEATVDRALAEGVVDRGSVEPREVIEGADLVVYATPVGSTLDLLRAHAPWLARARAVTDVGSVKSAVVDAARSAGLAELFVGGHPMCGRERSGYDAGVAELFADATVWLVPASAASPVELVAALWRCVGARPRVTEAITHDRLVAWSSHLPQILASALGGVLSGASVSRAALGPGGRDMARLAGSSSALWADILLQNRALLDRPVASFRERLDAFARALERSDTATLERLLEEARRWSGGA
jgi:prephenate dehydrogenase